MRLRFLIAMFLMALMVSCGSRQEVVINGQFFGAASRTIYLQELSPNGETTIDSTVSDSKGRFKFMVKLKDKNPTFLNVCMGNSFVPLLVEAGEHVKLDAIGNIYINYTVSGSKGSTLLRELNIYTINTVQRLDSLSALYDHESDPVRIQELGQQYSRTYVSLKKNAISFLVRNSSSLAAVVPLYQPIFGSQYMFDAPGDIAYFRMVSESLGNLYPTSPYVTSLRTDVERVNDLHLRDSLIRASLNAPQVGFIDIEMKDQRGQQRKLSSLESKVVLLDFTISSDMTLKALNREMVNVYDKFHDHGFEIYQVYLDKSKVDWLNSIAASKYDWITVSDFQGVHSPAVRGYNIEQIPANFLIDAKGNIIGKNLDLEQLHSKLGELLPLK